MSRSVYEVPALELLDQFASVCAELGQATICIDPRASSNHHRAMIIRGAILARIDQVQPPFNPRQRIAIKQKAPFRIASEDWWGEHVTSDDIVTIRHIMYKGNGQWVVQLDERDHADRGRPWYKTECFERVVVSQHEDPGAAEVAH